VQRVLWDAPAPAMLFTSPVFLFLFLPLVLGAHSVVGAPPDARRAGQPSGAGAGGDPGRAAGGDAAVPLATSR